MFCSQSGQQTLAGLIGDLPGLYPVYDVGVEDTKTIAEMTVERSLERRFALLFERDQLLLCKADKRGVFGREKVSLASADLKRRAASLSELQRACLGQSSRDGRDGRDGVSVLDPFAGWGMDALALASRGAEVTCVEQLPAMVALLRDASRRVPVEFGARLEILHGQAESFMDQLSANSFDVIYLDPMFPARKKGALPGKRLQWLAQLCGDDLIDTQMLIDLALAKASQQVVLKRRKKDPLIGKPARQVVGSTVRYDIYVASGSAQ